MDWPAEPVTLSRAAELFALAGRSVDRTNLGRFIASRNFPVKTHGRSKLVDAQALFKAHSQDYSRQLMSGETQGAVLSSAAEPLAQAQAPSGAAGGRVASLPRSAGPSPLDAPQSSAQKYDPKRDETELKAERLRLELAEIKKQTVAVEEVEAMAAEAVAELRSAFAQAMRDTAEQALVDLHLAAHMLPQLRDVLKRFARIGQEAFARRMSAIAGAADEASRERLERLADFAVELRGEAGEED